jgi:hypothetical protein
MAENLFGDAAFPDYTRNINDFFARIGRVAGRASQQAQSAQVNPYGGTMRGATAAPVRRSARELNLTDMGEGGAYQAAAMQPAPVAATPTPSNVGGGASMNPINALFAPMFEDLRRQRQLANQRYEANRDQVTNIYGQITGARSADKIASETAFQRLIDAASTRSTAVNTGIDASEAARLQQNQAALQGMGLEGLSTSQGDIASQTAAQAKQTNALNAANWEGMLRTMGATAGQQVDADVAAFNFARMEDLGQLRGAREEFMQDLGQQRGELRSQRAQATFEYQQAQRRAAAAAQAAQQRAAQRDATAQEKAAAAALKESGPVIRNVEQAVANGRITDMQRGANLISLVTEFMEMGQLPAGETWGSGSARRAFLNAAGKDLTIGEKLVVEQIFDEIKWR